MTHQNLPLMLLNFDDIQKWAPSLENAIQSHVPDDVYKCIARSKPEFIEDALETLFGLTNQKAIIDSTLSWISSKTIVGYHGSRLTEKEIASVLSDGLIPLNAEARRSRLLRALSKHPNWSMVEEKLDGMIKSYGNGGKAGNRQGQIHLTLSEAGLVAGFNHYLTYGAEFDQHVACALLGQAGKSCLAQDGVPILFSFGVPGHCALEAAHPYFTIEDICGIGEVPNIVKEFLTSWAFYLTDQTFSPVKLKVDCGMVFKTAIPNDWILGKRIIAL